MDLEQKTEEGNDTELLRKGKEILDLLGRKPKVPFYKRIFGGKIKDSDARTLKRFKGSSLEIESNMRITYPPYMTISVRYKKKLVLEGNVFPEFFSEGDSYLVSEYTSGEKWEKKFEKVYAKAENKREKAKIKNPTGASSGVCFRLLKGFWSSILDSPQQAAGYGPIRGIKKENRCFTSLLASRGC